MCSSDLGVQNYKDPSLYYSRLEIEEGADAISNCRSSNDYIPFQTHDFLVNFNKLIELDLNFKMLSLWRNPVDNIYSWWTRGWGERFMNNDPSSFKLLVKDPGGKDLPWYCESGDYKLNDLNSMECCVVMATDLIQRAIDSYCLYKNPEKIHLIFFEDLCAKPDMIVDSICQFLRVKPTFCTPDMILKARFPRELSPLEKEKKIAQFEQNLSPVLFNRLMDFSDRYQSNRYGLV